MDKNLIKNSAVSLQDALSFRNKAKKENKTFVLTNGCFDLLHSGHVFSLIEASKLGDYLWVAINSDSSIKNLKGPKRPIVNEIDRAYLLTSLQCVTGVTIFDSTRLVDEILLLKPDIYAKAGDYDESKINTDEHEALKEVKSKIEFVSFLPGRSTSSLINNIVSNFD